MVCRTGPKARLMLGAGFAALLVTRAGAQTPPQDAPPSPTKGIEQVVVTAQHKPEYAKNVPIAVTSLNGRTVADLTQDGQDIRALSAEVPSLYAESSFGRTYPRFYIRGLGNSDFTYNAQQPVSVVYDDVVEENAVLKAFPLFDIQDVEVLRGPQGTLFGRNTPAGVIKIESVKPSDTFSGFGDVSYGTYNTVNASGAIGGPIVPQKLDFRLAVQLERRDDWVNNLNPHPLYPGKLEGYSDSAAKFALLFKPSDDLDILLAVQARDLNGTARVFRADIIQPGSNKLVPGFKVDQVDTNGKNEQQEDQFATHLTVNYDLGPVRLTSISAWEHAQTFSRGDIDGGNYQVAPPLGQKGLPGFDDETSDAIPALNQLSQEFRVATTGDGPYFNQGGIYLFHENIRINSLDYFGGVPDISLYQKQTTESLGVFDSATYKITPDLTAGAGVRVSTEHKTYSVVCDYTCVVPTPNLVHANYTGPSFDVSLDYAVTKDANIYGGVATGYLGPALDGRNVEYDFGNTVAGAFTAAKAETTISYELGVKSSLFDNLANFNLSLFRWDTHDLQLTAVGGTTNSTQLKSAKKAIGEGVEAQIDARPIPNLLVSASSSYNFTQIQDPNLVSSGCGDGCIMEDPVVKGGYSLNGNPLPDAPRWVVDGRLRYTQPIADGKDIYFSTDWSFRSSVDYFLYQAVEFKSQTLLEGGLRLGYEDHTHGFEVAGYVRNVLNQVRVTGAIDFDNLTGFVNDPRIIGVDAHIKF